MKYWRNRWAVFAHDVAWVPLALLAAFWLRFNLTEIPQPHLASMWLTMAIAIPVQAGVYLVFKLYRGLWRYASMPDMVRIAQAVAVGVLLTFMVLFVVSRLEGMPRSVMPLYPLLLLMGLIGPRLLYRWYKDRSLYLSKTAEKRVLLIGAGRAGELLMRDILKDREYCPIGILDDDGAKHGQALHGTSILGSIEHIETFLADLTPDLVVLAIPTAPAKLRDRVMRACHQYHVRLLVLPGLNQLASDIVHLSTLREVNIEDVLGRDAVAPNVDLLEVNVRDKVVMVTGAGGSIGSELCRQILHHQPRILVLFERSEFALYQTEREIHTLLQAQDKHSHHNGHIEIIPFLGSVCHFERMLKICQLFQVQTIYHAAAYKHVPLVEFNPIEAVQNNIFGTLNCALAARKAGVEQFVLISTDKAVRPTNVMGTSKRCAELVLQALHQDGLTSSEYKTCFSMVRFGNVLGSSGSVVPLFREQIRNGGPITLTHKDITRYFMTIPEAAQLVIQAGAMAKGGEVFVLDMGEPIRILDLAQTMIRLTGLSVRDTANPHGDIEIVETGLRPGEKLYEELLIGESVEGTQHELIMQAHESMLPWGELEVVLNQLDTASQQFDAERIRKLLQQLVPEYQPTEGIHDLLWQMNSNQQHNLENSQTS